MDLWTLVSPFYDLAAQNRYVNGRVSYTYDPGIEAGPGGAMVHSKLEGFAAMGRLEYFLDVEFEADGWVDQEHLVYGLRGALDKPDGRSSGAFQVMSLEIRREPSGRVKTSVGGAAPQRRLGSDLTFEEAILMYPAPGGIAGGTFYADYIQGWNQPWASLSVTLESY